MRFAAWLVLGVMCVGGAWVHEAAAQEVPNPYNSPTVRYFRVPVGMDGRPLPSAPVMVPQGQAPVVPQTTYPSTAYPPVVYPATTYPPAAYPATAYPAGAYPAAEPPVVMPPKGVGVQVTPFESSEQVGEQNGIRFITGGIGSASRDMMEGAKPHYNTYISTAAASGAYVSGAQIVITGRDGVPVFEAVMEPLLYVLLPEGDYTVQATYEGKVLQRKIKAGAKQKLHFAW